MITASSPTVIRDGDQMSENISDLLSKAEDALWAGNRRGAGILLHKILLQDFTEPYAWKLLHAMLGSEQPLDEFQRSFAQKYYPNQAHLLQHPPPPGREAVETLAAEPVRLAPAPTTPAVELSDTAPVRVDPQPYPLLPDHSCSICGTACPPQATYCCTCGQPLAPAPKAVAGTGSLLLYRPRSSLVRERAFSIRIDGKQHDQIMDGEQRLLSLPRGPHTLVVESAGQATPPLQVYIKPTVQVRLVCQPAAAAQPKADPELKVFPYREGVLYEQVPTKLEGIWSVLRIFLIILFFSALAVTLYSIIYYMISN
jgi:hypothetical protein